MVDINDIQSVVQSGNTWLYDRIEALTEEQTETITNNVQASNKKQTKILGGLTVGVALLGLGFLGTGQYLVHKDIGDMKTQITANERKADERYAENVAIASQNTQAYNTLQETLKEQITRLSEQEKSVKNMSKNVYAYNKRVKDSLGKLQNKAKGLEKRLQNIGRQNAGQWKVLDELKQKTGVIGKDVESLKPKPKPNLVSNNPMKAELLSNHDGIEEVFYDSANNNFIITNPKKAGYGLTQTPDQIMSRLHEIIAYTGKGDNVTADASMSIFNGENHLDVASLYALAGVNSTKKPSKSDILDFATACALKSQRKKAVNEGRATEFNARLSEKTSGLRNFLSGWNNPIEKLGLVINGNAFTEIYNISPDLQRKINNIKEQERDVLSGEVNANDIVHTFNNMYKGIGAILNDTIVYKGGN